MSLSNWNVSCAPESVLDLPQLYQKPSFQSLQSALDSLVLKPHSWQVGSHNIDASDQKIPVARYLMSIVSNSLSWLDEEQQEAIWDLASKRIAERSGTKGEMECFILKVAICLGRKLMLDATQNPHTKLYRSLKDTLYSIFLFKYMQNGLVDLSDVQRSTCSSRSSVAISMPAMTRKWHIRRPLQNDSVEIALHEPGLTEDNLGLKTWGSSYVLSTNLHLLSRHLDAKLPPRDLNVLELGAGTGLVGLAAAVTWSCKVVLTDLPEIVPNLTKNALLNDELFDEDGRRPAVSVLDWMDPPQIEDIGGPFDVILAADPLYDAKHAPLLASNIDRFLRSDARGRVIIMHPLRDSFTEEMGKLLQRELSDFGFDMLDCGVEIGFDDWEVNGRPAEVRCWWGVWARSPKSIQLKRR